MLKSLQRIGFVAALATSAWGLGALSGATPSHASPASPRALAAARARSLSEPRARDPQAQARHLERKFARIRRFEARHAARVMAENRAALRDPKPDQPTAVALVIETMRLTGARVGSRRYATRRDNPTFGASSLLRRHVQVARDGRSVRLRFPGKGFHESSDEGHGSSRPWDVTIRDPLIARAYRLFTSQGPRRAALYERVSERTIADALRPVGARPHDYRGMRTTAIVRAELARGPRPRTLAEAEARIAAAVERAAELVNHKDPATTLHHYVDPEVLERYRRALR